MNHRNSIDDDQDAISEIIGALALIAILAVTIGIFAAFTLGNVNTEQLPAVNFNIKSEGGDLFIIHAGGDQLDKQSVTISVDGVPRTSEFLDADTGSSSWIVWDTGEQLVLPGGGTGNPAVMITWKGREAQGVLYGQEVTPIQTVTGTIPTSSPTPSPTIPPTTSPTPSPTPTFTPDSHNVLLNTARPGTALQPGYFQFRVTSGSSSIEIDGHRYYPKNGDIVRLTVNSPASSGYIYGSGSSQISSFTLPDVTLSFDGVIKDTGPVTGIWIHKSEDHISTLGLIAPSVDPPVWTQFRVDGMNVINGDDGRQIALKGMNFDTTGALNVAIGGGYFVCSAAYSLE
jgi:hypothetical protein